MSWRITGDRETGLAIEDEKGELVCEQVRRHEKLLVAAPDMLALCKRIMKGRVVMDSGYWLELEAAIAKAEGRQ